MWASTIMAKLLDRLIHFKNSRLIYNNRSFDVCWCSCAFVQQIRSRNMKIEIQNWKFTKQNYDDPCATWIRNVNYFERQKYRDMTFFSLHFRTCICIKPSNHWCKINKIYNINKYGWKLVDNTLLWLLGVQRSEKCWLLVGFLLVYHMNRRA